MNAIFNERKAAQAAAYLLRLSGGLENYTKIIKLLYIADRTALIKWNIPISTDHYVSMRYGPVLSKTYKLMATEKSSSTPWFEYIKPNTASYYIQLQNNNLTEKDCDELSRAERELLRQVHKEFRYLSWIELSEYTHQFKEWDKSTKNTNSQTPISIRKILECVLSSKEEINERLEEIEQFEYVSKLLNIA